MIVLTWHRTLGATVGRVAMALVTVVALALSGCATTPQATYSGTGTVESIDEYVAPSESASWIGAIGGALVGAVLGSQIGSGTGSVIAGTVGSVGGSVAGQKVASSASSETRYRVRVRFEDGITRTIEVKILPAISPGDRVQVNADQITKIEDLRAALCSKAEFDRGQLTSAFGSDADLECNVI
jgi:outer membrane lipoprotein SlyB